MKKSNKIRFLYPLVAVLTGILCFSTNILPAQEINPEEGLILYLPFSGNAMDESGNNVHTHSKGPVLTNDRHGNPQQALSFDGVNDFVELNHNEALIKSIPFTICMWVRIKGRSKVPFGHSNSLFSQSGPEDDTTAFIHFDAEQDQRTRFEIRRADPRDTLAIETSYPGDHDWHFFLCTLDDLNTMHIYIDGQKRASGTFQGNADLQQGITSVRIGSYLQNGQNYGAFYGEIDEVSIFDRALNPCEAETLYSGQLLEER